MVNFLKHPSSSGKHEERSTPSTPTSPSEKKKTKSRRLSVLEHGIKGLLRIGKEKDSNKENKEVNKTKKARLPIGKPFKKKEKKTEEGKF